MPRYCAEDWLACATRRYEPAGSAVNSNTPWVSVVAWRGRAICIIGPWAVPRPDDNTWIFASAGTPPTTPPTVPPDVPLPPDRPPAGEAVITGDRFTIARRIGFPVSAATTRPRMTPAPIGSGARVTSRGGICIAGGGGGGGGSTCGATTAEKDRTMAVTRTGPSGSFDTARRFLAFAILRPTGHVRASTSSLVRYSYPP